MRRWFTHLWREWTVESWRPVLPAFATPTPHTWDDSRLTAAWLGHSTVLINLCGINILTDPVLFPRIGIRLPGFTIGPKRLTAPALRTRELPRIDLVLLSHAHFDHIDTRTLHRIRGRPHCVTASRTGDLLRWMRFRSRTELRWGQTTELRVNSGTVRVLAFPVRHWGARLRRDQHRGYNGYVIEHNGCSIIYSGDTALSDSFAVLRRRRPYDLAIMSIGAYDPWIGSHANPEQAVAMANAAGAEHIMPVHHQTFRLSAEPFREPIERFEAALAREPARIAVREIGETFTVRP
ncbi:MAG TPA: MBL fold metallo-hydrolase [Chthoniobacterales bacterium]|nr:MBL fold metallo-hydrolase [Chthoniobacterales bacterium]